MNKKLSVEVIADGYALHSLTDSNFIDALTPHVGLPDAETAALPDEEQFLNMVKKIEFLKEIVETRPEDWFDHVSHVESKQETLEHLQFILNSYKKTQEFFASLSQAEQDYLTSLPPISLRIEVQYLMQDKDFDPLK